MLWYEKFFALFTQISSADVNIAGEAVLVGETLCSLKGRRALPVQAIIKINKCMMIP